MSAKFVAEEGALKGLALPFGEGKEWTIGRDPDNCEIVVEDPEASRMHARCHLVANGIVIENLSAEHPTQVNDKIVEQPRMLQEGDTVKIGSTIFRYHFSDMTESPTGSDEIILEQSMQPGEMRMSDVDKSHLGTLASEVDTKPHPEDEELFQDDEDFSEEESFEEIKPEKELEPEIVNAEEPKIDVQVPPPIEEPEVEPEIPKEEPKVEPEIPVEEPAVEPETPLEEPKSEPEAPIVEEPQAELFIPEEPKQEQEPEVPAEEELEIIPEDLSQLEKESKVASESPATQEPDTSKEHNSQAFQEPPEPQSDTIPVQAYQAHNAKQAESDPEEEIKPTLDAEIEPDIILDEPVPEVEPIETSQQHTPEEGKEHSESEIEHLEAEESEGSPEEPKEVAAVITPENAPSEEEAAAPLPLENPEVKPKELEAAPSETAEEVLEEALSERKVEKEENAPNSTEQDDIFPVEEHAIGAEKYSAEGTAPSVNNNTVSTNKDVMDTIFQDEATKDNKDLIAEVNFDMLETGRWLLKVVGGPNTGAEFSMQASSNYLIGTDPNTCDIVFHDTSVSRQHARITISDEDTMVLEDLKSRNGTMIDGKKVEGRVALEPNIIVSVGTTSFVVFDREGEMQTIISPMLPSIVKVLQQEEPKNEKSAEEKLAAPVSLAPLPTEITNQLEEKPSHKTTALGAFLLVSLVTGIFLVVGIGTLALFRSEPVSIEEPLNINATLKDALAPFKDIKSSYNQPSGRLLLVGHVLTANDKNQLIYNLQGLPFVKTIDDKAIIIDEYVTREINPILARNKAWKGVTIQTPQPGQFVLSGYLQTRDQAEQLSEYISTNFPNLDQLERRIIVEEEVINSIDIMLQKVGIRDVQVKLNSREVTLTGGIPAGKEADFNRVVEEAKSIPGISNVRSYVSELPAEASLVNISDRYKVSGASNQGGVSLSVVINGRILSRGDILDGMAITSIKPNAIFLEKDGIKYRVDY